MRVKNDSFAPAKFLGKEGRIHVRRRRFNKNPLYSYEIVFFDRTLNHPIMGTVDGFYEDDLEVIH